MDLSKFPLPSHACAIYTDGLNIILKIPGEDGIRSHDIKLPLERCGVETSDWGEPLSTQRGWYALLQILRARMSESQSKISTPQAPIQHQVDMILKAMKDGRVKRVGRKSKADDSLTLDDLEI